MCGTHADQSLSQVPPITDPRLSQVPPITDPSLSQVLPITNPHCLRSLPSLSSHGPGSSLSSKVQTVWNLFPADKFPLPWHQASAIPFQLGILNSNCCRPVFLSSDSLSGWHVGLFRASLLQDSSRLWSQLIGKTKSAGQQFPETAQLSSWSVGNWGI